MFFSEREVGKTEGGFWPMGAIALYPPANTWMNLEAVSSTHFHA